MAIYKQLRKLSTRRNKPVIDERYILALENSHRLEDFWKQSYGSLFEHFLAFDGNRTPIPSFVDMQEFRNVLGREPSLAEVGCSISHFLMCKKFTNDYENDSSILLVLEDDARLANDFEKIIHRVLNAFSGGEPKIILLANALGAGERNINAPTQRLGSLSFLSRPVGWSGKFPYILGEVYPHATCAGAYLINKAAAARYVNYVESGNKIAWPADFYSHWTIPAGIHLQVLRPGVIDWFGDSTIGGADHDWKYHDSALKALSNQKTSKRILNKIALKTRIKLIPNTFKATMITINQYFHHARDEKNAIPQAKDS